MDSVKKKFVPVMLTPFDTDLSIDDCALDALVEFYLRAGADGLFANCLSGEMFSITDEEKLKLVSKVVKRVDGRVPVVATGSFGISREDQVQFINKVHDAGAQAVILITSHLATSGESEKLFLDHFDCLERKTGKIPLGLYECPAPYKRIVPKDSFSKLLASDRLVYHKDTSINFESVFEKLEVLKNSGNTLLEFYDAHTPNASKSLQAGARGLSAISGNFYPEILIWLCCNAMNPDQRSDISWLQSELTRVDPLIHQAYPLSAKYFLRKRGLPLKLNSRSWNLDLTGGQLRILDQIHDDFLRWCERLKIIPAI
ncbi:MAG TPA: dihydrodipicolinate synthase family protein [Puia sp.]|nr:dihydrodipicolinate synthase family protein [Puia sp.]